MTEENHPRTSIRRFLRSLLPSLDLSPETVSAWPHVSPEQYFEAIDRVRTGTQHLLQFHKRQENVDFETAFYLELFGAVACDYLRLDWSQPTLTPEPEYPAAWFEGRPGAQIEVYNQQFCTAASSVRRARRVLEELGPTRGRVLLLGDDDLVSVPLAHMFQGDIHMLDIDERVLRFVQERAPSVQRRNVDLTDITMPDDMIGAYDLVMLDPHWFFAGAVEFLEKAIVFLSEAPHARILMSQCPHFSLGEQGRLHRWITRKKLKFERIDPMFSWYDLSLLAEPSARTRLESLERRWPSPLLKTLALLPYGFSNLYTLSRSEKRPRFQGWALWKQWWRAVRSRSQNPASPTTYS